ncbi:MULTISPECIES: phosphoribosylamine--glycine ligase [Turicibacter]|jgi:phosphoribosylamine--glycine ligase|uniref:Phosphoribosylamine--glycine ligase n=2 Tax=Turicibacter sanguinis TaxID=154288 RepID=A0A173S3P6_9FIRM|nr:MULTISPECIES: phosphoribosylamine--glycine ligase [Turicibacter]EFF63514.1 phosphoribosylamine--glycine ligase [Turicibacter sanguinis PC909]EGC93304.1 phosphoribosylamine--glycine ligase [Turicibacter sp. HGF1]MBP3904064.1 phosphoribosylamine--glycine ligase [Turicibacter sp.]MCU7191102.1 phosphoribosylamine--glycine ligase [Turicibacter sanguinis]MCU7197888.1 phosphoribosylamine--glycine ligase [Turicibacter sanguinis]
MKVLVIGRGGREHAIIKKLMRDKKVSQIFCAPGNDGMIEATLVPIEETNVAALTDFALENQIDLTIVGPEMALVAGVVNSFNSKGLKVFGPTKEAALIEGSKAFAKQMMSKYNIPTAVYKEFTEFEPAVEYLKTQSMPIVIKADGLAAGKGVVICQTLEEGIETLESMLLYRQFDEASSKVVIEEFLEGEEFSLMAFVANELYNPMPIARDYKRAYDNDEGLNTGGMGNHSPHPLILESDYEEAIKMVIGPMTKAMIAENIPFTGILYAGLMKTSSGIKVIEFNARFGDPETEVLLPRLETDLSEIMLSLLEGKEIECVWSDKPTVGVVLAAKGYPGNYNKGAIIKGLDLLEDVDVCHMGTKLVDGDYTTNGGRVLFVVGSGETLDKARTNVYRQIEKITCDDLFYRLDIAKKFVE